MLLPLSPSSSEPPQSWQPPVQPNSNGGLSLPDVARTVTRIEHSLDVLDKKWSKHIDWHMEQK